MNRSWSDRNPAWSLWYLRCCCDFQLRILRLNLYIWYATPHLREAKQIKSRFLPLPLRKSHLRFLLIPMRRDCEWNLPFPNPKVSPCRHRPNSRHNSRPLAPKWQPRHVYLFLANEKKKQPLRWWSPTDRWPSYPLACANICRIRCSIFSRWSRRCPRREYFHAIAFRWSTRDGRSIDADRSLVPHPTHESCNPTNRKQCVFHRTKNTSVEKRSANNRSTYDKRIDTIGVSLESVNTSFLVR